LPASLARVSASRKVQIVLVGHCVGQPEAKEAHERHPVSDRILGALIRQVAAGRQHQRLDHQPMVERRPAAFRAVRARHRPLQIRPKQFEIDHRAQPLQAVAFGRELLQPLVNVKKTRLTAHLRPPAQTPLIESRTR
jgi:hypothetical protein